MLPSSPAALAGAFGQNNEVQGERRGHASSGSSKGGGRGGHHVNDYKAFGRAKFHTLVHFAFPESSMVLRMELGTFVLRLWTRTTVRPRVRRRAEAMTHGGQLNIARQPKNQGAIDSTASAVHTNSPVGRMFRVALLQWLAAGLLGSMFAAPVDERRPYGRVCIGVVTGEMEEPLQASSKAGPNTHIVVHADANERCQMLVSVFNASDGKLAHNWLPQLVELPPWEEVLLPEPPSAWKWPVGSKPFDVYVLFTHPSSEDARDLKSLVTAMWRATTNSELLDRQSVKLRELATRSGATQAEIINVAKADRVEVAATFRSGTFPWREYASRVNFTEAKPSLLMFRVGD